MEIINTGDLTQSTVLDENTAYWIYNGLDCCVTEEILRTLLPQVDNVAANTYTFSRELQAPVLEMMLRGILVNQNKKHKVLREMRGKVERLEDQLSALIRDGVGVEKLNWRSPLQLNSLLYDVMGLPEVKKRNANGIFARTSNREAIEKLSGYFIAEPICNHLLALRDLGKSIGFLETGIDPDGRMRSNLNIGGTNSGRFSSSISDFGTGTNLQNVTASLRSVFVADPGYKFANLDLEQADSRNVGALCWNLLAEKDEALAGAYLNACESGDLHTYVCKLASPGLGWGDGRTDREIADQKAYRQKSYRDNAKVLGHGCLTEDHEVLTRSGWVKISEKPEEILAWSPEVSRFEEVSHWTDKLYSGDLHQFEGRSQDLIMTSNHRVPFFKHQKRPKLHVRAAAAGPATFMPLGNNWIGGLEEVPAKLIAAVMCDGHIEKNWTSFHFKKDRKFTRLFELCREYGIECKVHGDKVRVKGNFPKRPGPFMFNWTKKCLQEFITELKYWDGYISDTSVSISCKYREDLEWYQTFGRILGIGGNIQKPRVSGFGTTVYTLQQNKRQYASGISSHHEVKPVTNIRVLCPTVPSSFFYVRRNGKICVTGNSNYLGTPQTMSKHSKLPVQLVRDFQKNYFSAFQCIPLWHESVFYALENFCQLTTPFDRRRFFFGRPKEASTRREAVAYQPQSMTADEINTGILKLWRANRVQLLMQVHDSILFQYPEELEDEIIPWALETLKTHLTLAKGRDFVVPTEAMTGWNWGYYDEKSNPDGLKKWKGGDNRSRQEKEFKLSLRSM